MDNYQSIKPFSIINLFFPGHVDSKKSSLSELIELIFLDLGEEDYSQTVAVSKYWREVTLEISRNMHTCKIQNFVKFLFCPLKIICDESHKDFIGSLCNPKSFMKSLGDCSNFKEISLNVKNTKLLIYSKFSEKEQLQLSEILTNNLAYYIDHSVDNLNKSLMVKNLIAITEYTSIDVILIKYVITSSRLGFSANQRLDILQNDYKKVELSNLERHGIINQSNEIILAINSLPEKACKIKYIVNLCNLFLSLSEINLAINITNLIKDDCITDGMLLNTDYQFPQDPLELDKVLEDDNLKLLYYVYEKKMCLDAIFKSMIFSCNLNESISIIKSIPESTSFKYSIFLKIAEYLMCYENDLEKIISIANQIDNHTMVENCMFFVFEELVILLDSNKNLEINKIKSGILRELEKLIIKKPDILEQCIVRIIKKNEECYHFPKLVFNQLFNLLDYPNKFDIFMEIAKKYIDKDFKISFNVIYLIPDSNEKYQFLLEIIKDLLNFSEFGNAFIIYELIPIGTSYKNKAKYMLKNYSFYL